MIGVNGINQDNTQIGKNQVKPYSKQVALYVRVSTLDQHPENQEIELKRYAMAHNYEIYNIYIDRISGAKETRPSLDQLMQDARAQLFDAVIIWKVDRLGRSVAHMAQIIQEWENLGIDFIITTLGVDTTKPAGKLVLGVLMQIAEFERELIRERILLGLDRRRKEGKTLGRPKGAKDKNPKGRRKSGYYVRWAGKKTTPRKNKNIDRRTNEE